jgi:hypothetical protein
MTPAQRESIVVRSLLLVLVLVVVAVVVFAHAPR